MTKLLNKYKTIKLFYKGVKYYKLSIHELCVILIYVFVKRIEKWHITQLASAINYQFFVIEKIKSFPFPLTIIDIGCGLGLIARKLRFTEYLGIDSDSLVLKCADKLKKTGNINFIQRDATSAELTKEFNATVILALNFLHHYDLKTVKNFAIQLGNYHKGACLIFDYNISPHDNCDFENEIKNLGMEVIIYSNESGRNRDIFFVTLNND